MALWKVKSPMVAVHGFEVIEPVEVLDALDGPLTFTFRDRDGDLLLANLCAVGVEASRYLVSKTNEVLVLDLKNGLVPLRSALIRGPMWLIDVKPDGHVASVWNASVDSLPPEVIPDPSALLTADLEAEQRADEKLARFSKSNSDAQIAFDGGPVESHAIDAGFFGKFVQLANDLFAEICELVGAPSTSLRLGMTFESSYGVDLRVAEKAAEVFEIFPIDQSTLAKDASRLRKAFDVFASLVVDPEPNADGLTLVKLQYQLRQQYGKVLELISTSGAIVVIRTRTNPRPRSVSGSQAGDRLRVVRELGYPFMILELRGVLFGGQTQKSGGTKPSFKIRVNAGEKPKDFIGAVPDSVVDRMHLLGFDAEVWAKLKISDDAKEQQSYELIDIRAVDDGSPHYVK